MSTSLTTPAPSPPPDPLFPYQIEGANWLARSQLALLSDEMGLGKTAQVIRACDLLALDRVLVLCPANARINWQREFDRFGIFYRNFDVILSKKDSYFNQSVICSYSLLEHIPTTKNFVTVILDEAHYLKNHSAHRTKLVFSNKGICRRAKRVWAITGTPMPNNPSELWVILHAFGCTKLRYEDFVQRYCTFYDTPHGRHITGARVPLLLELKKILEPIMLRRKKEDVMKELPPIHYVYKTIEPKLLTRMDIECEPSFGQYFVPVDRCDEFKEKLSKEIKLVRQLIEVLPFDPKNVEKSTIQALEAIAPSIATLRRYIGMQKVEPIAKMIHEDLTNKAYKKVVIFAVHQCVIEGLRSRLKDFGAVTLYGQTPVHKRQYNVDRFQNDDDCQVFIGNIQAAGVAITLTAASTVFFAECSYCPGDLAQAALRCHRIGQKKTVLVTFLGAVGTIDDKITNVLKVKTKQISALLDGDEELILPSYYNSLV